jgi:hypothetical protein
VKTFTLGAAPTTREAQAVADEIFADFVSKEVRIALDRRGWGGLGGRPGGRAAAGAARAGPG